MHAPVPQPALLVDGPIALRPPRWSDLIQFWRFMRNPLVYRPIDQVVPPTLLDEVRWYRRVRQGLEGTVWTITAGGRVAGNCRLFDYRDGRAELGVMLGQPFWGQGIGTTACRLLCQFGRDQLGLKQIYLEVQLTNQRAIRIYERLGFQTVAQRPNHQAMILELEPTTP